MNYDQEEDLIEGCPVEEVELKSKGRASGCQTCGFFDWEPGDVKFIIEHWMNDESTRGGREHLCPACAVNRGLSKSRYHQNKNAPILDLAALKNLACKATFEQKKEMVSNIECDSCGKGSGDRLVWDGDQEQKKGLIGFIAVYDSINATVQSLCLMCAVEKNLVTIGGVLNSGSKKRSKITEVVVDSA